MARTIDHELAVAKDAGLAWCSSRLVSAQAELARKDSMIRAQAEEIARLRAELLTCQELLTAWELANRTSAPTYTAANNEELPRGAAGTTVINDGRAV